jgi:Sec-independent protein secretion pathway component TatC
MSQTGYGNIHGWLGNLALDAWVLPASGLVFVIHGLWASRHRAADLWVLLGVAAIVARTWAYHQVYDDLLLIVPLIALYRLGRGESPDPVAWALFIVGAAALVAPVTPILSHASWALVAVWLLQLGFLIHRAGRAPSGAGGTVRGRSRSIAA